MRRGELLRIARTRWVLPGDVNIYVADRGASVMIPTPRMAPFRQEKIELRRYVGEPELHSMGYGPETNTLVVRMATVAL